MRHEKFKRNSNESLIILKCSFPQHQIALALDTGASHTTIDLTALYIAGYRLSDAIKPISLETANGVIEAHIFKIKEFTALGITKFDMEICAYDFFAHHVLTEFDGVLGLDFFEGYKICIDFNMSIITLQ